MTTRKKTRQKWLGAACLLEEQSSLPWERTLILVIVLVTIGFVIWASLTPVDELVAATGELVPENRIVTVEAAITGIVEDILVNDGTIVKADEPLVRLQVDDTLEDIKRYDIQRKGLNSDLYYVEKELDARTKLANEGLFPPLSLIPLQAKRMELLNKIEELNEASTFRFGSARFSSIQAPISGQIQELRIPHRLASIRAGEALMEIVPLDSNLFADIKIRPADVGNIHLDQQVLLRITTFDTARYGVMTGKIIFIAPATTVARDGLPFFRARVQMDQQYVSSLSTHERHSLLSGMMVDAEIKTGSKTIMDYMLKPVQSLKSDSMHER